MSQSGAQESLGPGAFGQWLLLEMVHTTAMGAGMELRITGPGISRTIALGSYSGPGSGNPAYVGLSGDAWWDDVRAGYGPVPADTPTVTPTEAPTDAPTPTPTDTPTDTPTEAPVVTPTATATATATPDASLCDGGCGDPYLAFRIKAPKKDALGAEIAGNPFPRNFVITLNDVHLDDGDPDDPENFVVRKEKSLLNAARLNGETGPNAPDLRYVRYQTSGGKEGVGPADGKGRYPKAVKHIKRVWQLENRFGTINVVSKKQSALLVPAAASNSPAPSAPGDATHFTCYQVKVTKDLSGQTPDNGKGKGTGRFRKDLQAFLDDSLFADCALLADGVTPSFQGTAVSGSCLFDLTKPVELCNPANKTAVEPSRTTVAVIDESIAATDESLLCYKVKRAKKLKDPVAAALVSGNVGDKIAPKQAKHRKRSVKAGNPVYVKAGNQFPAPVEVDTRGDEMACIPTSVLGVSVLP